MSRNLSEKTGGFTMIELLVVLAIIGVLLGIVVLATNGWKSEGNDAGVQTNLLSARAEAAIYYTNNNGNYTGLCANAKVREMMRTAARAAGIIPDTTYTNTDVGDWNSEACHALDGQYAMWVPLSDSTPDAARGWCVDHTNASVKKEFGSGTALAEGDYTCD